MSDATYAVVFTGEIADGFDKEEVKAGFGRLFGLGAERLEQLFAHPRVVLKQGLLREEAERYLATLGKIGALASLEPPLAAAARVAPAAAVQEDLPVQPAGTPEPAAASAAASTAATAAFPAGGVQVEAPAAAAPVATPSPAGPFAGTPAAAVQKGDGFRERPFEFTGKGGEFFRIWIVNLLLSIITLGIYSAWAKVRTQRYFYGNTRLDGSSFEYLADPIKILKGRIIAFVLLVIYVGSDMVSPVFSAICALLLFIGMPWIIVRSLSFRNHNSAWRGVRFGFDGRVGTSAKVFLMWPLLGMLTLGLLFPLAMKHQQRFLVGNSRYGSTLFDFSAGTKRFYALVGLGLLIAVCGFGLAFVLGLAFGPLGMLGGMATYLAIFVYFNVATTNLIYGSTSLAEHQLSAHYNYGSYAGLMVTNLLCMVLTFGLFYPWAKVRTARYAAEHISLLAAGDLDGFIADQRSGASATGGEIGDLFDIDIGL